MARPVAKDYDDKRQAILKTAARVFAEEGVARASMAQVASACGISKANIYHYYPSKDVLIFDILNSYLSKLCTRVCDLPLEDLSGPEQLRALCKEILLAYEGMDAEHKIQIEGVKMLPEEQQEILKDHQRNMVRRLRQVLAGNAPDLLADRRKLRAATMSVFGMLNWFYMWNPAADVRDRTEYAGIVTAMALEGLKGVSKK